MSYTNLTTLSGVFSPIDYGSGIQYAQGLLDLQPGAKLNLGLWLGGLDGLKSIVAGDLDSNIRRISEFATSNLGSKIYLRIGYEFDNPQFNYQTSPPSDLYIRAYQHISSSLRDLPNIIKVWHSYAQFPLNLDDYYPGDSHVDYIGVSLFQAPFHEDGKESMRSVKEVINYAEGKGKEILIAESASFGGTDIKWFDTILNLMEEREVGVWCYISTDWDAQRQWKGVGFGDTRVPDSWWRRNVVNSLKFAKYDVVKDDGGDDDFVRWGSMFFIGVVGIMSVAGLLCLSRRRRGSGGYVAIVDIEK
ncbi:hypothetical protein TrVE_jg6329 [Triparma verrucosa]|uniref:GH26 domain-containing protein n=1 Tax=Triparma verrucosa TaxID=1606542 RepID=A0A9W7BVB1_9STRA|nr:hypothetical protein TrVE_jg6329 [Triparma verrucosa]